MKKKILTTLLLTFLSVGVVGGALIASFQSEKSYNSKATTYYVRLNESNAYEGVDQFITTSSGEYALGFHYEDVSTSSSYHCVINEDGTITNKTNIKYITSVHAVWQGSYAQLQIRYSRDGSSWSEYALLESDQETFISTQPYFFEVKANNGPINLSSLTIHYSCSDAEDLGERSVKIFATNDIHGQVYPESPQSGGSVGIGKLMTYIKEHKDGNTLALDQGDTWQGSVYSNYNYGNLINDVMSYVRYDARTIGNHDFDWGIDKLKANTARSYQGYTLPTLAANVYDFDFATKVTGTTQQADIGRTSVSYTLANGLKVGIVGVIGSDQITSIDSSNTHDIAFVDHTNVIKDEATKLRNDGCDIVIASIHSGYGSVSNRNLGDYVDLVLCGHTHFPEVFNEGDVYFAQFGNNTNYLGEIELVVDELGNIETNITTLTAKGIDDAVTSIDSNIQSLIDEAYEECEETANQVVVKDAYGEFYQSGEAVNLMCEAIYNSAKEAGYNIDLAYANKARHDLGSYGEHTTWTYSDLYEAFPFDNKVYIFDIGYDEIVNEILSYNWICKEDDRIISYKPGSTIKIACLDYLAFHTDRNRYYDYFPCIENYEPSKMITLNGNYREILRDYLLDNDYDKDGKTLSYGDYSNRQSRFNKNEIKENTYKVTLHLNNEMSEIKVVNVKEDQLIINVLGENPVWRGHKFEGWFIDEDLSTPLSDEKNVDIDLYAKWSEYTPKKYGLISSIESLDSGVNILYAQTSDLEVAEFTLFLGMEDCPNIADGDYFEFLCFESYRFTSISLYLPYDDIEFYMDYDICSASVIPISEDLYEYKIECFTSYFFVSYCDSRMIPLSTFIVTLESTE